MSRKMLSLILAGTLCLSMLAGCSSDSGSESAGSTETQEQTQTTEETSATTAGDEQVLRIAESSSYERPSYDPAIVMGSKTIRQLMHDTLMKQDQDGNMVPSAAESYEVSDDGLVYTFHLRQDLKWSDGQPITAEHFVYTLVRACTAETGSENAYIVLPYIKNAQKFFDKEVSQEEFGVKALDDYTLEITLEHPTGYFIDTCDYSLFAPSRPDVVEADPEAWSLKAETCIVNGPFKPSEFKQGEKLEFVKNENYWNVDAVKLEKVTVFFFADSSTAYSAYQTGEVDICNYIPSGDVLTLFSQNNPELIVTPSLGMSYLSINNEKISDVNLRKAIFYAIDREKITDSDVSKITTMPLYGMVPPGIMLDGQEFREVAGDYGLSPTADVEQSKKYLEAAGYPNGEGMEELTILAMNTEDNLKAAQLYQEMLRNVGIPCEIQPVESKIFYSTKVEGNYDLSVSSWAGDYVHPMTFLEFKTSNHGENVERYNNPAFDEAILKAQTTTDSQEQLECLMEAEKLLIEDAAVVPLTYKNNVCAVKPYVKGFWRSTADYESICEVYIEGRGA